MIFRTYILSKPENWIVYEIDIVRHGKDGRDAIRSGIHELIAAGYITRKRIRDEKGQFNKYEYKVSETPDFLTEVSKDGLSNLGKPAHSYINLIDKNANTHRKLQEQAWKRGEIPNQDGL